MTVAVRTPLVTYAGNGVTVNFPVPFRFLAPAHLQVDLIDALGVVTPQSLGPDFGASGGETDAGGTVTMVAPPPGGARLRIRRATPRSQETDYQSNDRFPAETNEMALDKGALIDQEQDANFIAQLERALMVPEGEIAPPVASLTDAQGKLLRVWNHKVQPYDAADFLQQVLAAIGATLDENEAALVGWRGSSVFNALDLLLNRKARRTIRRLFDIFTGGGALKVGPIGDSLGYVKAGQIIPMLDRMAKGKSESIINTAGNVAGGSGTRGGALAWSGASSGATTPTGQYTYWPTGEHLLIASGGYQTCIANGVTPTFTSVTMYVIKEPGAGTAELVVDGNVVATLNCNAAFGLGKLTFTQARAQKTVRINATSGAVRVVSSVYDDDTVSGVTSDPRMQVGGLALTSAIQSLPIWQAYLADRDFDLVTFEMDDAFGTDAATQAAFATLCDMLAAAIPTADKIIIASTPRAVDDAGKVAASAWLAGQVLARDRSFLFFDSYWTAGSWADLNDVLGGGDGTHPAPAAQFYNAALLMDQMGLSSAVLPFSPQPLNSTGASNLGKGSAVRTGPTTAMTFDTDTFALDWRIGATRSLALTDLAGTITARFSSNSGVISNILPTTWDFGTSGSQRKFDINVYFGYRLARFRDTQNVSGLLPVQSGGLWPQVGTRANLNADFPGNSFPGFIGYVSDAANGLDAGPVFNTGRTPTHIANMLGATEWVASGAGPSGTDGYFTVLVQGGTKKLWTTA